MTTRKNTPKKPKARRMYTDAEWQKGDGFIVWKKGGRRLVSAPVAVLDVSDPDALIAFVAKAINDDERAYGCGASCDDHARAALTALGVLPKRRGSERHS